MNFSMQQDSSKIINALRQLPDSLFTPVLRSQSGDLAVGILSKGSLSI